MNKSILVFMFLLAIIDVAQAVRIGMRFDDQGNFINPDDYLVYTALEADKDGYKNDAKWRLKDAAEFGNKHAQYYIGLLHLQEQQQVKAYAWLKLAGKGIANNDFMMASLEKQLSSTELNLANEHLATLKQTYNFQASIERRAEWKKRLSFGGTHIKGHVPVGWKTELMNGVLVFDHEVKKSLENFVFDYRYDEGEVTLKDFEAKDVEIDKPI